MYILYLLTNGDKHITKSVSDSKRERERFFGGEGGGVNNWERGAQRLKKGDKERTTGRAKSLNEDWKIT